MKTWEEDHIHEAAKLIVDDMELLGVTKFEAPGLASFGLEKINGWTHLLWRGESVSSPRPIHYMCESPEKEPPRAELATLFFFADALDAMAAEVREPAAALREESIAKEKKEAAETASILWKVATFIKSYSKQK